MVGNGVTAISDRTPLSRSPLERPSKAHTQSRMLVKQILSGSKIEIDLRVTAADCGGP
jgi:hypothetical protein